MLQGWEQLNKKCRHFKIQIYLFAHTYESSVAVGSLQVTNGRAKLVKKEKFLPCPQELVNELVSGDACSPATAFPALPQDQLVLPQKQRFAV